MTEVPPLPTPLTMENLLSDTLLLNSPKITHLSTGLWRRPRGTCGTCSCYTDLKVQQTRMAPHAGWLGGSCYKRLLQPHLCSPFQPDSRGESSCVCFILFYKVTWFQLDASHIVSDCRRLPSKTWINRERRSMGSVFCFASWLWPVSSHSFYRFASTVCA